MTEVQSEALLDGEDVVVNVSHKIENLSKDQTYEELAQSINRNDYNAFYLGGLLCVIQDSKWYSEDGFNTLKEFVTERFGMNYRRAMYYIAIYRGLVNSEVPWDKVKHLGWSKLKELAHIITDENCDHWIKVAEDNTVLNLKQIILDSTKDTLSSNSTSAASSNVSTMSFKVHEDQKENIGAALDKAMHEADTDNKSVALDSICMAFNSGTLSDVPVSQPEKEVEKDDINEDNEKRLLNLMKEAGWEEVFEIVDLIFPEINVTVTVPQ